MKKMNRYGTFFAGLIIALLSSTPPGLASSSGSNSPNVIWVMAEDISTDLACYGHPAVKTPNLDKLAQQGVLYTNAFTTAPSCTPSRNAMMTGVYQTRTDTQDQRRRGIKLPDGIQPITYFLRQAGYFTALGCGYSDKTDLNSESESLFEGSDWTDRVEEKPDEWFDQYIDLPKAVLAE
jgi:arylsulfatase A-like enzyme